MAVVVLLFGEGCELWISLVSFRKGTVLFVLYTTSIAFHFVHHTKTHKHTNTHKHINIQRHTHTHIPALPGLGNTLSLALARLTKDSLPQCWHKLALPHSYRSCFGVSFALTCFLGCTTRCSLLFPPLLSLLLLLLLFFPQYSGLGQCQVWTFMATPG